MSAPILKKRPWIYLAGLGCGLLVLAGLNTSAESYHAAGPPNPGHEDLACGECHRPAVGTPRQQLQANVAVLLGLREHKAAFVHREVRTSDCQACHLREHDRHPVYRFDEPRFENARAKLGANECMGCHVEHSGERASVSIGLCVTCHENIELKEDPLDISHATLAASERWQTCLGCHDYHGNHKHPVATELFDVLPPQVIEAYLLDGDSPYGPVIERAQTTREESP